MSISAVIQVTDAAHPPLLDQGLSARIGRCVLMGIKADVRVQVVLITEPKVGGDGGLAYRQPVELVPVVNDQVQRRQV